MASLARSALNGQICGREWPLTFRDADGITVVLAPERDSLEHVHANKYVRRALTELLDAGLREPAITIIGEDIDGATTCTCVTELVLYSLYELSVARAAFTLWELL